MQIYRKVLAYITYNDKLLVFTHRDAPEAGVQVPGGTVEPDESIEDALYREIAEESGIEQQGRTRAWYLTITGFRCRRLCLPAGRGIAWI